MRVLITMFALVIAGCGHEQPGPARALAKPPTLEMRLIAEAPDADCEAMTFTSRQKDGSTTHELLQVRRAVLLSETTVKTVWVWKRGMFVGLDMTLADSGRVQLADLTRQNIGKRVAVMIDGQVRAAPEVKGEISNGRITIVSDWGIQGADQLARRFEAAGAKRSE